MSRLPPRGTGLSTGRAGKRRAGKPRTQAQRLKRHNVNEKAQLLRLVRNAEIETKVTWEEARNDLFTTTGRFARFLTSRKHVYLVKTRKKNETIEPIIPKRLMGNIRYSDNHQFAIVFTNHTWKKRKTTELIA